MYQQKCFEEDEEILSLSVDKLGLLFKPVSFFPGFLSVVNSAEKFPSLTEKVINVFFGFMSHSHQKSVCKFMTDFVHYM